MASILRRIATACPACCRSRLLPILLAEGHVTKTGRPFDKSALYKLLVNRVYIGEAVHKGTAYPGEHDAIIPRDLWDRAYVGRVLNLALLAPDLVEALLDGVTEHRQYGAILLGSVPPDWMAQRQYFCASL